MIGIDLYNEDCLTTLSRLEGGSVDLLLQDTPYGCTKNEWDSKPPDLERMWPEWLRVCKVNAAMIFFSQQPFTTDLILSMRQSFRYDIVWQKTSAKGFLNANRMPLRSHETIVVFYRKLPTYNPQKTKGHKRKISTSEHKRNSKKTTNYGDHALSTYDSSERYPKSVLTYSSDTQKSSLHPNQKPIDLIRWLIRSYSNPGELVFDGYSGSGTTAAACAIESRRFVGAELREDYYQLAIDRLTPITCDATT